MTPIPTERLEELIALGEKVWRGETVYVIEWRDATRPASVISLARELLAAREALANLIRDHDELRQFVLNATDPSNWDAARFKGEYYEGQHDAREEFHEIAAEHIDCDVVKKARALLPQPEKVAFPGRGLPQGDL